MKKTIQLTAGYLTTKLSWKDFCELIGADYGYNIDANQIFNIPESKVKQFI